MKIEIEADIKQDAQERTPESIIQVRWWDSSINRIWIANFIDVGSYIEFKCDIEPINKILSAKVIE